MAQLPKIDSEGLRLAAKEGRARVSSVVAVRKGGPTEAEPDRPYCKPDQSCCDFCCGN